MLISIKIDRWSWILYLSVCVIFLLIHHAHPCIHTNNNYNNDNNQKNNIQINNNHIPTSQGRRSVLGLCNHISDELSRDNWPTRCAYLFEGVVSSCDETTTQQRIQELASLVETCLDLDINGSTHVIKEEDDGSNNKNTAEYISEISNVYFDPVHIGQQSQTYVKIQNTFRSPMLLRFILFVDSNDPTNTDRKFSLGNTHDGFNLHNIDTPKITPIGVYEYSTSIGTVSISDHIVVDSLTVTYVGPVVYTPSDTHTHTVALWIKHDETDKYVETDRNNSEFISLIGSGVKGQIGYNSDDTRLVIDDNTLVESLLHTYMTHIYHSDGDTHTTEMEQHCKRWNITLYAQTEDTLSVTGTALFTNQEWREENLIKHGFTLAPPYISQAEIMSDINTDNPQSEDINSELHVRIQSQLPDDIRSHYPIIFGSNKSIDIEISACVRWELSQQHLDLITRLVSQVDSRFHSEMFTGVLRKLLCEGTEHHVNTGGLTYTKHRALTSSERFGSSDLLLRTRIPFLQTSSAPHTCHLRRHMLTPMVYKLYSANGGFILPFEVYLSKRVQSDYSASSDAIPDINTCYSAAEPHNVEEKHDFKSRAYILLYLIVILVLVILAFVLDTKFVDELFNLRNLLYNKAWTPESRRSGLTCSYISLMLSPILYSLQIFKYTHNILLLIAVTVHDAITHSNRDTKDTDKTIMCCGRKNTSICPKHNCRKQSHIRTLKSHKTSDNIKIKCCTNRLRDTWESLLTCVQSATTILYPSYTHSNTHDCLCSIDCPLMDKPRRNTSIQQQYRTNNTHIPKKVNNKKFITQTNVPIICKTLHTYAQSPTITATQHATHKPTATLR